MYQIGDTVVCGSNGVCLVEEIGPLTMMGKAAAGRSYYTLKPCYDSGGRVYLPVDGDKENLRPILTRSEVEELVGEIESLEQINISDEKMRETEYKSAVNSSDPRLLVRIIKTMYNRKKMRIESGKKSTAIDERYFRIAEKRLYEEMALALDVDRDDVKEYIWKYIEK